MCVYICMYNDNIHTYSMFNYINYLLRGNHSSNTTCLTQVFFKSGE